MNGFPSRRYAAAAAAALALVAGGIGAGGAAAQGGGMSTSTSITGHAGLGSGSGSGLGLGLGLGGSASPPGGGLPGLGASTATPGAGRPGIGLFKAFFAVFGAVRTAVPTIAAPIIAQAVTAGTITPAEAAQLTGLLAGRHPAPAMGVPATPPKPSAGEIAVLHSVIAAILGQVATIAAPVLAAEVTAGDITQSEADMITKILTGLGALKAGGSSMATGLATQAAGGALTSSLESTVAAQIKQHTKARHKHARAHRAA